MEVGYIYTTAFLYYYCYMDISKLPLRFVEKFTINEDGCWVWIAGTTNGGYGRFKLEGKTQIATRFAWTVLVGDIPPGLVMAHYRMDEGPEHAPCTRACVNPAHLRPMTQGDNIRRGGTGAYTNNGSWHKVKTHCPQGHPYNESNTYNYRGCRRCKACRAVTAKNWYDSKKLK